MGAPPAKRQTRRLVHGLPPDGPLQTGTSVNHKWVGAANRYLLNLDPADLNFGRAALFGDLGIVGAELNGYPESHVGPTLCAQIGAERAGQVSVADKLRERAEDLLCEFALFLPQNLNRPLVPVGHRQGWIVASPGGDVEEDSTESMKWGILMAQSGKVEGPGRDRSWWDHDDHLVAWAMRWLIERGIKPPRIPSDWRSQLERVRAHLGLTVSLVYVRHQHGWRAHLSAPHPNPDLRPYDNPHYAVASGPRGVRVLSPAYPGVEAWPLEPARVVDTLLGFYRASCRVERERGTPRARVEDWSGEIRWDDLGLGPELGRWQLAGPGRAPWSFGPAPPPPEEEEEEDPAPEEPKPKMIPRHAVRAWLRKRFDDRHGEALAELAWQAQRWYDGEVDAEDRLAEAVEEFRSGGNKL